MTREEEDALLGITSTEKPVEKSSSAASRPKQTTTTPTTPSSSSVAPTFSSSSIEPSLSSQANEPLSSSSDSGGATIINERKGRVGNEGDYDAIMAYMDGTYDAYAFKDSPDTDKKNLKALWVIARAKANPQLYSETEDGKIVFDDEKAKAYIQRQIDKQGIQDEITADEALTAVKTERLPTTKEDYYKMMKQALTTAHRQGKLNWKQYVAPNVVSQDAEDSFISKVLTGFAEVGEAIPRALLSGSSEAAFEWDPTKRYVMIQKEKEDLSKPQGLEQHMVNLAMPDYAAGEGQKMGREIGSFLIPGLNLESLGLGLTRTGLVKLGKIMGDTRFLQFSDRLKSATSLTTKERQELLEQLEEAALKAKQGGEEGVEEILKFKDKVKNYLTSPQGKATTANVTREVIAQTPMTVAQIGKHQQEEYSKGETVADVVGLGLGVTIGASLKKLLQRPFSYERAVFRDGGGEASTLGYNVAEGTFGKGDMTWMGKTLVNDTKGIVSDLKDLNVALRKLKKESLAKSESSVQDPKKLMGFLDDELERIIKQAKPSQFDMLNPEKIKELELVQAEARKIQALLKEIPNPREIKPEVQPFTFAEEAAHTLSESAGPKAYEKGAEAITADAAKMQVAKKLRKFLGKMVPTYQNLSKLHLEVKDLDNLVDESLRGADLTTKLSAVETKLRGINSEAYSQAAGTYTTEVINNIKPSVDQVMKNFDTVVDDIVKDPLDGSNLLSTEQYLKLIQNYKSLNPQTMAQLQKDIQQEAVKTLMQLKDSFKNLKNTGNLLDRMRATQAYRELVDPNSKLALHQVLGRAITFNIAQKGWSKFLVDMGGALLSNLPQVGGQATSKEVFGD